MLSSMKQCVGFVAGRGMPDDWPEHFGVAQESPGLPAHCEDQVRKSVVAQSLQGHLWVKKDSQTDRQSAMRRL